GGCERCHPAGAGRKKRPPVLVRPCTGHQDAQHESNGIAFPRAPRSIKLLIVIAGGVRQRHMTVMLMNSSYSAADRCPLGPSESSNLASLFGFPLSISSRIWIAPLMRNNVSLT